MKEWFKYRYGFVNIDDEAIYLTENGNWSETKGIQEKVSLDFGRGRFGIFSLLSFLIAFTIYVLNYFVSITQFFGFLSLLLLILGSIFIYLYLQNDKNAKFKIPLNKVNDIRLTDKNITILFISSTGAEDSHEIIGVETKGRDLISSLNIEKRQ